MLELDAILAAARKGCACEAGGAVAEESGRSSSELLCRQARAAMMRWLMTAAGWDTGQDR